MILSDHPVRVVMIAAAAAPLIAELPIGVRLPVVVLEVALGIAVGPHGIGWLVPGPFVEVMFQIGMASVLFMAGMAIDFGRIRGRPAGLALGGWGLSPAIGFAAVALLHVVPGVHAPLMVTIALATTGLGVLLPALRDGGQLGGGGHRDRPAHAGEERRCRAGAGRCGAAVDAGLPDRGGRAGRRPAHAGRPRAPPAGQPGNASRRGRGIGRTAS